MTVTDLTDDPRLPWASRVDKLLRKAEATTPEEAQLLTAKAEEIMVSHAIDEELLAFARGKTAPEKIIEKSFSYTGIYRKVLQDTCHAIAKIHHCRTLQSDAKWDSPPRQVVYVIGFESDVEKTIILATSLQIQGLREMQTWWKSDDRSWYRGMEGYKARREFFVGYASGLTSRLREAQARGTEEGTKRFADQTGTAQADVKKSTELALRSKSEQVKDWFDKQYGGNLRYVTRRYQSGGAGAYNAGHDAGRRADIGQPGIGRNKQLGRG